MQHQTLALRIYQYALLLYVVHGETLHLVQTYKLCIHFSCKTVLFSVMGIIIIEHGKQRMTHPFQPHSPFSSQSLAATLVAEN